jgi:hypothetical protein
MRSPGLGNAQWAYVSESSIDENRTAAVDWMTRLLSGGCRDR